MELKATDLRIGNYYDHHGEIKQVTPGVIQEVWESDRIWCKPVKITEDILLRLGFDGDENEYNIGLPNGDGVDLSIEYCYGTTCLKREYVEQWLIDKYKDLNKTNDYCYIKHPIYLHELQNLYHSLTGEELKLKEQ